MYSSFVEVVAELQMIASEKAGSATGNKGGGGGSGNGSGGGWYAKDMVVRGQLIKRTDLPSGGSYGNTSTNYAR